MQPKANLRFDEWLTGERASPDARNEYVDGEVFAINGASAEHNTIVSNIDRELSIQMKGRPCWVYANDMKVRLRAANAGKYPNPVAHCGDPEFEDRHWDLLPSPSLIVELLSESSSLASIAAAPTTQALLPGSPCKAHRQSTHRQSS